MKFRFAFGGGAGYVTGHEHMWDTIGKSPSLACCSCSVTTCTAMTRKAARCSGSVTTAASHLSRFENWLPGPRSIAFGTIMISVPMIAVVVLKSIPPPGKSRFGMFTNKIGLTRLMVAGAEQPGCWYDFYAGDIHFIMLDGRYYRHRKDKTMLGPAQKAWLKKDALGILYGHIQGCGFSGSLGLSDKGRFQGYLEWF